MTENNMTECWIMTFRLNMFTSNSFYQKKPENAYYIALNFA